MHKPLSPTSIRPPAAAYSHGMEVAPGARLVFCSGQLGIAPDGTIPADCAGQARLCFSNIAAILAESGMSFENVVRINTYLTGREHLQPYMEVRDSIFAVPYPASTLLVIAGLSRPEFVIEVEVVAAAAG